MMVPPLKGSSREPLRVVRVIGRLNIGGPAQHVVLLNQGLTRLGYETHLVGDALRPGEDSMAYFAEQHGEPHIQIPELVTDTSVGRRDARAVRALTRVIRDVRPHIVHTHTAKAGFLGRVAARLARTPVLVHTFHGHVLHRAGHRNGCPRTEKRIRDMPGYSGI